MKKEMPFPDNHKRALSSSLYLVEKLLIEMEEVISYQNNACCSEINMDIDNIAIYANLSAIIEVKKSICFLVEKYKTTKKTQRLQRIIDAKRTKVWEILNDTFSNKLKGYDSFPQKYANEYDTDISKLIGITNKITY
jgi:hypothetical protein